MELAALFSHQTNAGTAAGGGRNRAMNLSGPQNCLFLQRNKQLTKLSETPPHTHTHATPHPTASRVIEKHLLNDKSRRRCQISAAFKSSEKAAEHQQ